MMTFFLQFFARNSVLMSMKLFYVIIEAVTYAVHFKLKCSLCVVAIWWPGMIIETVVVGTYNNNCFSVSAPNTHKNNWIRVLHLMKKFNGDLRMAMATDTKLRFCKWKGNAAKRATKICKAFAQLFIIY